MTQVILNSWAFIATNNINWSLKFFICELRVKSSVKVLIRLRSLDGKLQQIHQWKWNIFMAFMKYQWKRKGRKSVFGQIYTIQCLAGLTGYVNKGRVHSSICRRSSQGSSYKKNRTAFAISLIWNSSSTLKVSRKKLY